MPIETICQCERRSIAPDSLKGKETICPDCGSHFIIGEVPSTRAPATIAEAKDKEQGTLRSSGTKDVKALHPASLCCPHCKSDQTQKVSVICEAGTQHENKTTFASGFAMGDRLLDITPIFGSGKSISTVQSTLALRLGMPNPPKKDTSQLTCAQIAALFLTFLGSWMIIQLMANGFGHTADDSPKDSFVMIYLIISLVLAFISCWLVTKGMQPGNDARYREAQIAYQTQYDQWQHSFFCHRCGQTFIPV
jgi:hypothetical protein